MCSRESQSTSTRGRASAGPSPSSPLYLVLLLGIYAAVLTTVAVADPGLSFRLAARNAAELAMRRPGATLLIGLALLLVNLAGIAAAVMPFLTITLAYSFVAVAHFVVPPEAREA